MSFQTTTNHFQTTTDTFQTLTDSFQIPSLRTNFSVTGQQIQATHKKNTLLQAATGNPEGRACKREFFSPPSQKL
ncbi:MAG: hypothetical protein NTY88_11345 [Bacteroidetes bacterium]|nr:hypothetical protein [Bacteroidota bacterium]